MVVFKFIFWFMFALVNTKFVFSAIRWLQTEKEDRDPFWQHIVREVFGRII